MTKSEVLGQVAVSSAGRDKGRLCVVVGALDESHVLVADGELRKISSPKKKKYKHLRLLGIAAEGIHKELLEGKKPPDSEIRGQLRQIKESMDI